MLRMNKADIVERPVCAPLWRALTGEKQLLQVLAVTCLCAGLSRRSYAVGHHTRGTRSSIESDVLSFLPITECCVLARTE